MSGILWTERIGFFKKLLLNLSGMSAWISGNMKDTEIMKKDIKSAYNGDRSADVEFTTPTGRGITLDVIYAYCRKAD